MNKKEEEKLNKIVRDNYELIADHYSETRKKFLWPALFELVNRIESGAKVLDVGCGSGKLLQALGGKTSDYLGIDPSAELLKNARINFSGCTFQKGDIMDLRAYDSDYNYVFCIAVLQHIPARRKRIQALIELGKRIDDSGKVVVSVWDMWNNKRYRRVLLKNNILRIFRLNKMEMGDIIFDWKNNKGKAVSKRYYHAYKLKELVTDCEAAGFKIDKVYRADNNIFAELRNRID